MLTLQEQIELRDKIANDQISVYQAKELYWKDLNTESRSWHTKDWKDRRDRLLKEKCEICNGKEILTIQHFSHPRKYNDYENEITRKYLDDSGDTKIIIQKGEFLNYILKNYNYYPIPLCPKCQSRRPNHRITKVPIFLCTKCHFEFNDTTFKTVEQLVDIFFENKDTIEIKDKCFVSKDKWKNKNNLKQIEYWLDRNKVKANNTEKIEKEAFLLYLDDNIKYLSFEDTITACKKCAAYYDLYNLELCPNCKLFYKGIEYSTCIQCLPEDRRKSALKKVEFGKRISEIHNNLGID
jgi:hypothetical protein